MDKRNYVAGTPELIVQDCSAATENILIAANALGIGGVWLGLYPMEEYVQKVSKKLQIPEGVEPFSIVSLGYPAEHFTVQDRFGRTRIHYEQYHMPSGKE